MSRDYSERDAALIPLALPGGARAALHPRGATLDSLWVPDRQGRFADVLLGAEKPGEGPAAFSGTTVGRFANRIAGAGFTLDGTRHALSANEGANCLHGGAEGFADRVWQVLDTGPATARLRLVSRDGDQGFPGRVQVEAAYALSEQAGEIRLEIELTATSDRPTVINLTNHAYFNLGGTRDPAGLRGVDDHRLTVAASRYLPVGPAMIPLPEAPVPAEGPFDWRNGAALGERLRLGHPQMLVAGGIDHCFALDGEGFRRAALLEHPPSGRVMELWTDQPGLQVYTANGLDGTQRGKMGAACRMGDAICLEPGGWPDAPNRPDFPGTTLRPGQVYRHLIALVFPPAAV